MKRFLLFFCLGLMQLKNSAQTHLMDSLKVVLSNTTNDSARVNLLIELGHFEPTFQKGVFYAAKGLELAQKINYKTGEADAMAQLGGQYRVFGNYPMALHYAMLALQLREQINDTAGMARGYFIIGLVYRGMGDSQNEFMYLQRAISINRPDNIHLMSTINGNLGRFYYTLNKMDSALYYYQKSYEYYNKDNDQYGYYIPLTGLGDLQFKKGNTELAMGYYREALRNCLTFIDSVGYAATYDRMAILFNSTQNKDSAIYYSILALQCAQAYNNYQQVNSTATMLSKIYQTVDDKLTIKYLQIAKTATDSLLNLQKSGLLQSLFLEQKEREQASSEQKMLDAQQRKQNIQFALIAFGIITFIIIFLLLSRSIITNTKMIEFLGVVALLIVFEFLNLLLHPFLERVTHHSPMLMLLALVCIAALLVPLHHKIEHWVTAKLVEKNKQIRLAAAKKTIEQLEKGNDASIPDL